MTGDLVAALLIALGVIGPARLGFRQLTRPLERRGWLRVVARDRPGASPRWLDRVLRVWLTRRLRIWIRLRQTRYSLPFALERGLQIGLPIIAVAVATVPDLGDELVLRHRELGGGRSGTPGPRSGPTPGGRRWSRRSGTATPDASRRRAFARQPAGNRGGRLLVPRHRRHRARATRPSTSCATSSSAARGGEDVRFIVISSDVVYPDRGDEGLRGELLAAVQGIRQAGLRHPRQPRLVRRARGFAATFLEPEAAARRRCARGSRPTTASPARPTRRIEELIAEAGAAPTRSTACPPGSSTRRSSRSRPSASRCSPSTPASLRRVDPAPAGLAAGGARRGRAASSRWPSSAIRSTPAGTTRPADDEDVRGHPPAPARARRRHRDGGRHARPRVLRRALRPRRPGARDAPLRQRRRRRLPELRHRAGLAGRAGHARLGVLSDHGRGHRRRSTPHAALEAARSGGGPSGIGAWPFSAEWLSAAFDFNVAPFFQSFVEVRVEPSAGRVRLLPYGVHGRLRWVDLQASAGWRPATSDPNDLVEIVLPMRARAPAAS